MRGGVVSGGVKITDKKNPAHVGGDFYWVSGYSMLVEITSP